MNCSGNDEKEQSADARILDRCLLEAQFCPTPKDYLLHQYILQVQCLAKLQVVAQYTITTMVIASLETFPTAGAKVEDVSFISLQFRN